jgi:penicillin-binding protein 1A
MNGHRPNAPIPRAVRVPVASTPPGGYSPFRITVMLLLAALVITGGWGLWKWRSLHTGMPSLPETAALWNAHREPAIEFLDRDGYTIAIRGPRYGRAVALASLPEHVRQAFIAAEDKRFYEHDGADEAAIARAVVTNAAAGETRSGASTITQQVIKNLVLDSRQTMQRKAQEITLARELEKQMSKDEILTLYLNRIYFGAGLYGLDAAARFYFGKAPEALELHESALLAALPKAPSRLNLRENLDGARARRDYVLGEMLAERFISRAEADAARAAPVTIIEPPRFDPQLGHVLDLAAEQLRTLMPNIPPDAIVTLTLDTRLQQQVHARLTERLAKDGGALAVSQAGVVLFEPDGRVAALVGGVDYTTSAFSRVTQARRQPGSSFKPFVFAQALEDGYSPYDVFVDQPIEIGNWRPANYGGEYFGPMTMSEALTRSTNTIAAELIQLASPERTASLANRFGITSELKPFPSLALGSQEVTLWELTRAYGVFQSGGYRLDPYLIERVTDTRGNLLYERAPGDPERVYSEDYAADLNAMLMRVINAPSGTGGKARFGNWAVAGKTGTSQDWRDAWFVGFTSAYLGGVWTGNDDDSPMRRVTGGGLPAEIWSDIMKIAHEGRSPQPLIGASNAVIIDPAAEERITFYRGMAQAFGAAAGRQQRAGLGDRAPRNR